MSDTDRITRDWQRRFGRISNEQRLQWHKPVMSVSLMIMKAEVESVLWSKRFHEICKGQLRDHAGYNAIARLLSNGIRVAKEINILIEHGCPKGANARWRTLHEITVITQFIRTNPPCIGERYRAHTAIREYRAMKQMRDLSERLAEPVAPDFLVAYRRVQKKRDEMIQQYGAEFKTDYGWSVPALKKKRPRMSDLEKSVNMDNIRPLFSFASRQIHSGPDSIPWHLDPARGDDMRHVYGPDTDGSAIPGILAAHTFTTLRMIWRLANDTKNPFLDPDMCEKDVTKIHDEGIAVTKEFLDCEVSAEHLMVASQLLRILTSRTERELTI